MQLITYGPGIPGVKGGKLRGAMASTITGIMAVLAKRRIVSDAGDYGGVMIWKDNSGAYRCNFNVYQHAVSDETFKTKKQVRAWLTEWFPKQRERTN
jgi:hypothetical protein